MSKNESSKVRKFHLWNFRSRERKFSGTKVLVTAQMTIQITHVVVVVALLHLALLYTAQISDTLIDRLKGLNIRLYYNAILCSVMYCPGVVCSLLGAIGIHCTYYFTYIPYNYQ